MTKYTIIMSQSTINTNLSACFQNQSLTQYYDEFFKQIPLCLPQSLLQSQQICDQHVVKLKIKWLIAYFLQNVKYKSQLQKMLQPIADISHNTLASKRIIKNLCNLKVMLKHCSVHEIAPHMTQTIFALICPSPLPNPTQK